MNRFNKFVSLALMLVLSTGIIAQTNLKPNDKIPTHEDLVYGKLDNGLTYYILKNSEPSNRGEFYLINNVGAVQETAAQNGLAHFTEHMCFNGTKNFEEKEIINYLESIGMKFGPEINAYTSFDETVYTLNKVPLEEKANIDTSLMILYEWSTNVAMTAEEIDAERGVIREEWRTRRGADFRLRVKYFKTLLEGSKYADHSIIGELDVIDNAPYDTLRAFYNTWYRPENQAIIAVGDFDVKEIENKIKTMFSKIEKTKNPVERVYYQIPDHKETKVDILFDKEAKYNMIQIYYKHDPVQNRNNAEYYRNEYLNNLYSLMLNARLSEKQQLADPPYIYAYSAKSGLIRTKDAYMAIAIAGNDKVKTALEEIITENIRVKQHGFSEAELERAISQLKKYVKKAYDERNKEESSSIARSLQQHFLKGEPYPGIEWEYEFAMDVLDNIDINEINKLAPKWIVDENRVAILTGPESNKENFPSKQEVLDLFKKLDNQKTEPYVDKFSNRPLVENAPEAGKIVNESTEDNLTILEFENGVKVKIMKTDFKDSEIIMRAYSPGGTSLYSGDMLASAKIASDIVNSSGVGEFDNVSLNKKLSDKMVNIYPYIGTYSEGFRGSTTPEDLETLLQLTYLYFTNPRADKDAFESYITKQKEMLKNKNLDPSAIFSDSLSVILGNYHQRSMPTTAEELDKAQLSKVKYVFKDRFNDPGGFTFYFVGNIDIEKAKPVLEKYLGGLPKVSREENFVDVGMRYAKGENKKSWTIPMETPKTTVFIAITGEYKNSIENRILIESLKEYLDKRMLESLREELGGTYGAAVFNSAKVIPISEYFIGIYFDTDPEMREEMINMVYTEINKFIKEGPDSDVLKNIIENKVKEHNERIKKNSYWASTLQQDDSYNEDFRNFEYNDYWQSLSVKDVKKAAKKFLKSKNSIEIYQTGN